VTRMRMRFRIDDLVSESQSKSESKSQSGSSYETGRSSGGSRVVGGTKVDAEAIPANGSQNSRTRTKRVEGEGARSNTTLALLLKPSKSRLGRRIHSSPTSRAALPRKPTLNRGNRLEESTE